VFDIYETMGDLLIRRLGDQNRYPSTKADLDRGCANHRTWIRQVFAPQLAWRAGAARERMFYALAAATDVYTTPLMLVRFSAGLEQGSVVKLQRALDGLAELPVHVVATTGGIVEPEQLAAPANAVVLRFAAHQPILARASLVVMHGGHGTAIRAFRAGVPGVVIPELAGDQPFVTAACRSGGRSGRCLATPMRRRSAMRRGMCWRRRSTG
jgi:hypothetical protein